MADLSDVESAIVALITSAIYPSGTGSPSAITLANATNPGVRIFAGWPVPAALDADMQAGIINISVYAEPGMERNVTRYTREWVDQFLTTPTITATVSNSTVTIGGTITTGHYVSILVFGKAFSYACLAGDTTTTVATALAALINAVMPATSSGAVITIPGRTDITARTGAPGTIIRELKRQQRRFRVTVWAPTNDARVSTIAIIDPVLAATDRLSLPDNTTGRMTYERADDVDRSGKQSVMCRDTLWWVEYGTTQVMPGYPITVFNQKIVTPDGSASGFTFNQNS